MKTEVIRKSFLPLKIKILLVGESPPNSGSFFYKKSAMTTFTSRPFEKVYGLTFKDNQHFLKFFKDKGCYLDDLSHDPVDHLKSNEREQLLISHIGSLSERLKEWDPEVVCVVLKKIEKHVKEAIKQSGIAPETYIIPFPGLGHQNKFIASLTDILIKHKN